MYFNKEVKQKIEREEEKAENMAKKEALEKTIKRAESETDEIDKRLEEINRAVTQTTDKLKSYADKNYDEMSESHREKTAGLVAELNELAEEAIELTVNLSIKSPALKSIREMLSAFSKYLSVKYPSKN